MAEIGTALAFPLRPNGRGGFATVSGVDAVEDSLRAIIESMRGSHTFEPWMGLPPFVFRPIQDLGAIAFIIKEAIIAGDSRIDPDRLEVRAGVSDSGIMPVTIHYSINGEATGRTLRHGYRTLG